MSKTEKPNDTLRTSAEQQDNAREMDYVRPAETYKERHSRKPGSGEKGHSGSTKRASGDDINGTLDGYVFSTPRRKHRRRKRTGVRVLIIILCVILALALATGSTYIIMREVGRSQMQQHVDEVEIVLPEDSTDLEDTEVEVLEEGKTIVYQDDTYTLNEEVSTVAFIGVDDGTEDNELFMADAIYLLAIDPNSKKVTIISVSRDTISDVNVYSDAGSFIDTEKMQISFAYSFANDNVTGGENTSTSVSRLFFGLPFKNYFAINMDALIALNDEVGGVTLTSSMTFESPIDGHTIYEGDTVTLYGKEVERYVRSRDTSVLSSNADRMERQKEYITAFMSSIVPAARKDIGVVSDLYNTVRTNSDTTLTIPKMTYMASSALSMMGSSTDVEFKSIKGTYTAGEYAEFNVDDKQLLETMLDVFYNKAD